MKFNFMKFTTVTKNQSTQKQDVTTGKEIWSKKHLCVAQQTSTNTWQLLHCFEVVATQQYL